MEQEVIPVHQSASLLSMMFESGPVVQLVLFILIGLSVWSWAIVVAKILQLRKARIESDQFTAVFWQTRNFARIDDSSRALADSPLAQVFASGFRELANVAQLETGRTSEDLSTVERALRRAELTQTRRLERGITFLATVASAAPFIGLFGTVWGIMTAFHGLSTAKSTTIQAVAPGISEALVATAIGLAAAIPAAIAYNYFAVAVRGFRESMNSFIAEFLTIARRQFPERS